MNDYKDIEEKAKLLRKWSLIATTTAGSGHPTSCLSAADLAAVLFDKYFNYDLNNPKNFHNDRFVLSKGHAAPLFYALFAMSGAMPLEDLKTLRKFNSPLEGHPTPNFPFTDAATGSLGQGLSVGAGMALTLKRELQNANKNLKIPKVYVMLGDGEMAEGQIWEAANFASYYALDNLIVLADVNRLGQSQATMFGYQIEEYIGRFRAFGFEVIAIDGHNYFEIDKSLEEAIGNNTGKPYVIIAKTIKGKGVSFLQNSDNWHGKPVPSEKLEQALSEIGEVKDNLFFNLSKTQTNLHMTEGGVKAGPIQNDALVEYSLGEEIATREVYGKMLVYEGGKNNAIYALDGDVKNSTYSQDFLSANPMRFVECFIAEQNMVSVAVGLSRLGKIPFVSTFGAFLTRAADQIRMAGLSKANISFCGSHAGVSIGEDGPSQMALEDIALFGTIPDSIIFHPCDAVSMVRIMPLVTKHVGISYIRTLRSKTPVIYHHHEKFEIAGSKMIKKSSNDLLTVVAAGITVYEALKAYRHLSELGIIIRVLDCYSIKPIDQEALIKSLSETKQKTIITVEDHFIHGGLGDFVQDAVSQTGAVVHKLAVSHFSRSGTKEELQRDAGIDASHIIAKVKSLI